MKMLDMKMTDKNDGRTRSCRRTNRVLTVCKFLNPKHLIHCAYSFIPACAQVGKLIAHSTLIFDIFRIGSSRLHRSNAKSTQSIQPQTFAASESVVLISCSFMSCYFMSCIFMSCHLVHHFHVLQFHALHIGPSI